MTFHDPKPAGGEPMSGLRPGPDHGRLTYALQRLEGVIHDMRYMLPAQGLGPEGLGGPLGDVVADLYKISGRVHELLDHPEGLPPAAMEEVPPLQRRATDPVEPAVGFEPQSGTCTLELELKTLRSFAVLLSCGADNLSGYAGSVEARALFDLSEAMLNQMMRMEERIRRSAAAGRLVS